MTTQRLHLQAIQRALSPMLVLGLCLLTALDAAAQWPRGPGNGYAQISLGRAAASQGFDTHRHLGMLGAPDNPEEYGDYAVYGYLEYGLTDELTLIASMYGKHQVAENLTESFATSGLSDLSFQFRKATGGRNQDGLPVVAHPC